MFLSFYTSDPLSVVWTLSSVTWDEPARHVNIIHLIRWMSANCQYVHYYYDFIHFNTCQRANQAQFISLLWTFCSAAYFLFYKITWITHFPLSTSLNQLNTCLLLLTGSVMLLLMAATGNETTVWPIQKTRVSLNPTMCLNIYHNHLHQWRKTAAVR